jgi:glutathione S-transferase
MDELDTSQGLLEVAGRRDFIKSAVGVGMGTAALAAAAAAEAAPSSAHLVIYHVTGRSHRVLWLMEELGLPYQLALVPGGDVREAMASVKSAHPMAMVPVLVDHDLHLVESEAIVTYIINKYGNGRLAVRPNAPNYANYLLWMAFAEGSASPRITADYTLHTIPDVAKISPFAARQLGGTERVLNFLEQTLGKSAYLAGPDFTAADIMMHFPVRAARLWGVDLKEVYPNTHAWMGKIETRPAFLKAAEKGSPNGALTTNPPNAGPPLLSGTGKTPKV